MFKLITNGAVILTAILALSGCGSTTPPEGPKQEPAHFWFAADVSQSTALIQSPNFRDGALRRVDAIARDARLGDVFHIIPVGSRTAERAGDARTIRTDYTLRLPSARKQLEGELHGLLESAQRTGGDPSTNLLYTLSHANITCTPRSVVAILSDGIEASDTYNVGAKLSQRAPIHLPPPPPGLLKGCVVAMIGIGVTPMGGGRDAETLPEADLQRLTAAWREWLQSAGVQPSDMSFTSIL